MRIKDREIEKVNALSIKSLERKLYDIDKYEEGLKKEFDERISLILGDILESILEVSQNIKYDSSVKLRKITINNKEYEIPINFLVNFHKSYINDSALKQKYEEKLKIWFDDKTDQLKNTLDFRSNSNDVERIVNPSFALASLAVTCFHQRPNMVLRDVQKLASLALNDGDIAELGTGEGKTLAAVLVTYLQALREKGVHVVTANNYLSQRDFIETKPIYEGLGLTVGFVYDNEEEYAKSLGKDFSKLDQSEKITLSKELKKLKQSAYKCDITYGSKESFAFDYLRDSLVQKEEDYLQRVERVGFALIDEVDDCLIDDAKTPYQIAFNSPTYVNNMSLLSLCQMLQLDYNNVLNSLNNTNINVDRLSFEEARYVALTFKGIELTPDPLKFQEAAQRFFSLQKVYITQDNTFGFKTSKEVYDALLDEEMYDADEIRNKYGIIYCPETKEYKISDKCCDEFLKYCYFSYHVNSYVSIYEEKIKNDKNYVENNDYYFINNKLRLTMNGANKILNDLNYPEFVDDYNRYLANANDESCIMMHYLQKCIIANLLMKNGEDYIVIDNKVKTLKNGRIMEGSTYSDGLHQAIEIKEKIKDEFRTKETIATSSITQKEFFGRYDFFSGMTGTSSKKVFGEIFGKSTVEIPKDAFYSYYSRRRKENAKAPLGILKKDTKYTKETSDKINLIVNSVIESLEMNPKQPVLLVVSNYDEIKLLEERLEEKNISYNSLTAATSKEDEALIIARAGLPGSVTISTEMAGRGTDIKIGGDRDTILDIGLKRHIKQLEKKCNGPLDFTSSERDFLRKKVEKALEGKLWSKEEEEKNRHDMEEIGLKVISSGFFKMNRIDRQLEGRCGRNGVSGVCERFVSISDLKDLGLISFSHKESVEDFFDKFETNSDKSLIIDEKTLNEMEEKIFTVQKNIEDLTKEDIKASQKLNSYATKVVEEYRDKRRKIITNQVEFKPIVENMIEEAVNAIISSFIMDKELSKKDLTEPINKSRMKIEIEAISLEVKKVLGITFDYNIIEKSNVNLLELRGAIIRTVNERLKILSDNELKKILLIQNDFIIGNAPIILDNSFTTRNLASLSLGLENQVDALANIEFSNTKRNLVYESYKKALANVLGLPLDRVEFKKLEMLKDKLYSLEVKNNNGIFEIKNSKFKQNNKSVIDKLKEIKRKIEKEDSEKLDRINKKLEKKLKKGDKPDSKLLYKNLNIRPLKFIKSITGNKNESLVLAVSHNELEKSGKRL